MWESNKLVINQPRVWMRLRFAGHCWRSKEEFVSNVLLWTPNHGTPAAGRPRKMYMHLLAEDGGCQVEDLKTLMEDQEEWRERGSLAGPDKQLD